ncbi:YbaB/EbfC family nucleoid-associated protein [Mycolicibacterium wolinskyi]|uniref:DNA-binding protein n=1 Tax=Mycolicibacterium wolinskyi TaxID=59750 RepID=A0A1X2ESH0_9MYCO|nr:MULTISPECIES: YbaB/EbfC family nucleoid-associated protein [Mycolicibacterium]MCV7288942.1 YbaB/EbfC family nucleoid-associated protein [Mycolicibacterium wolinskyi]MCV7296979.1 YbaB/EbfC family nucleoid-associated protein [Mycolicibacterium goodii]ORX09107.1 DNA-binding protein [Mycolicibacterium wolinskyi]
MTDDVHPQVAAVLRQAQQLQSLMDDQLHRMSSQTFTASDETDTVEVSLNGHHHLTSVFIEDGLLRLGASTVEQRLNEALQKATAAATASIDADRARLDEAVARLTAEEP